MALVTDVRPGQPITQQFASPNVQQQAQRIQNPPPRTTPGGVPQLGNFDPLFGQNEALSPFVQNQLSGINLNTQSLDALRNFGLTTGISPFQRQTQGQLRGLADFAQGNALQQARARGLEASSDLAASGGISRGTQARLASDSAGQALGAQQAIEQNLMAQQLQVAQQAEADRLRVLEGQPGRDIAALEPDFRKAEGTSLARQFDIGNIIKNNLARNEFNLGKFQIESERFGAERQAHATENAGKK